MRVPEIACKMRIQRKDSQYHLVWSSRGPRLQSPGNLTGIRDLGKKGGSSKGKITTISIDDFELLFSRLLGFEANALYHAQILFYFISASSKIASAYYAIGSALKYHRLLIS